MELKKVLIRAPGNPTDLVISFPFFHALKEEFNDAQIFVIVDEDNFELINFLPFELKAFSFPKEKNTLWGIHHFCYNLIDVFNIDYYFDLENSFNTSFMGLAFRSKKRISYKKGFWAIFLTHKLEEEEELNIKDVYYMNILKKYLDKDILIEKYSGGVVSFLQGEVRPYILLWIDKIKNSSFENNLINLISKFDKQHFIVVQKQEDKDSEIYFKKLIDKMDKTNSFEISPYSNINQLIQLIVGSKGVFADRDWKGQLISYFGVDGFSFLKHIKPIDKLQSVKTFPTNISFVDEKIKVNVIGNDYEFNAAEDLVDYIYDYLML